MTEYKKLMVAAIALMVLATATLVGLAVVNQFSYVLRTSTDTGIDGITPLYETAVSLGSSYPFPQTLTGCFDAANASVTLPAANYTITEGTASGGFITLDTPTFNNTDINCSSLVYLASNTATTAATSFTTGLTIFATFAAVVALALVGKVIVNIFRKKK